jgi:ion channel-forming bestrophin family protein
MHGLMARRHDWYHSFVIRGSVLPRIYLRLLFFTMVGFVLTYARERDWLFDVPILPATIMGSAVGLHIAFRTNSGYERFWEARTAWGAIVNRTRNIGRQLHAMLDGDELREGILLTLAFVHGAKHHFWRDAHADEIDRLLGEARSRELHRPPGPPQRSLLELGHLLWRARRAGRIDSVDQLRVEEDLTALIDQFGICQRIRATPLPNAYVIQLRTSLTILLLFLPLGIQSRLGWYTPLAMFAPACWPAGRRWSSGRRRPAPA